MKCQKCNGKGFVDNERYYSTKEKYKTDYYLRYDPTIVCNKCRGSGYIIEKVAEVLSFLKHLEVYFHQNPDYKRQVKQCIEAIEK
jgi:RecJ-like exonuclease